MSKINVSLEKAKKDKLFYVVATVVVINKKTGKALLLKRSDRETAHPGKWSVPGGKLEWSLFNDKPPTRVNGDILDWEHGIDELLSREVYEEAGVSINTRSIKYLDSVIFIRPDSVPVACLKFTALYNGGKLQIDANDFSDYAWVDSKTVNNYDCILGIPDEVKKAISLWK